MHGDVMLWHCVAMFIRPRDSALIAARELLTFFLRSITICYKLSKESHYTSTHDDMDLEAILLIFPCQAVGFPS
jgi:hypothetical protein